MSDKPDSKEKTIIAAAKLLRRHGYNGTALSDILAEAGSPRGSLYFHFPKGKEEIAVAALAYAADSVRQAIAGAATTSSRKCDGPNLDSRRSGSKFQEHRIAAVQPQCPEGLSGQRSHGGLRRNVRPAFRLGRG